MNAIRGWVCNFCHIPLLQAHSSSRHTHTLARAGTHESYIFSFQMRQMFTCARAKNSHSHSRLLCAPRDHSICSAHCMLRHSHTRAVARTFSECEIDCCDLVLMARTRHTHKHKSYDDEKSGYRKQSSLSKESSETIPFLHCMFLESFSAKELAPFVRHSRCVCVNGWLIENGKTIAYLAMHMLKN